MGSGNPVDAVSNIGAAALAPVTGGASLALFPIKDKIKKSKEAQAAAAAEAEQARAQAAAAANAKVAKTGAKAAGIEAMYKPVGNTNTFGSSGRARLFGN